MKTHSMPYLRFITRTAHLHHSVYRIVLYDYYKDLVKTCQQKTDKNNNKNTVLTRDAYRITMILPSALPPGKSTKYI